VKRIPSDAPTALIAPSDYQHIYSESKKQPQRTTSAQAVKRLPSDAPTALIAPSDYQHIYSEGKKQPQRTTSYQQVRQQTTSNQQLKRIPSDAPTALIAPSDYQHIYNAEGTHQKPKETSPQVSSQMRPTPPPQERQQGSNILPQSVIDAVERFISKQPKKYVI
jgi:hypothetical protein